MNRRPKADGPLEILQPCPRASPRFRSDYSFNMVRQGEHTNQQLILHRWLFTNSIVEKNAADGFQLLPLLLDEQPVLLRCLAYIWVLTTMGLFNDRSNITAFFDVNQCSIAHETSSVDITTTPVNYSRGSII